MVIFLKINYILFWKVGVKRIYMIKVLYDYFFSLKIEQIRFIAVKVNLVILLHFFFIFSCDCGKSYFTVSSYPPSLITSLFLFDQITIPFTRSIDIENISSGLCYIAGSLTRKGYTSCVTSIIFFQTLVYVDTTRHCSAR